MIYERDGESVIFRQFGSRRIHKVRISLFFRWVKEGKTRGWQFGGV